MDTTTTNIVSRESWTRASIRISEMISRTSFDLDARRDINCETSSTHANKKNGKMSRKEKRYDKASKVAWGVLEVFPVIMKNNKMKEENGIAMYYKKHVEPLLCKLADVDGDAFALSDDDVASYGSDKDDKRLRIVKAYSPRKN